MTLSLSLCPISISSLLLAHQIHDALVATVDSRARAGKNSTHNHHHSNQQRLLVFVVASSSLLLLVSLLLLSLPLLLLRSSSSHALRAS